MRIIRHGYFGFQLRLALLACLHPRAHTRIEALVGIVKALTDS
jgi:hypothetical protein